VGVRRTAPVAVAASGARWREGRREPGCGPVEQSEVGLGSRRERSESQAEAAGAEAAVAAAKPRAGTGEGLGREGGSP
jgi:hypothetical protein